MTTYANTISRVGPAGPPFAVLYQKSDFVLADLSTPGSYWIGKSGIMQSGQFSDSPFDVTGFTKTQIIGQFGSMTGTSPSLTLAIYLYDDPTGLSSFDGYGVGANYATGATHCTILGNTSTVSYSNVDLVPALPLWVRIQVTSGGTITGLGSPNRLTLIGMR